MFFSMFTQEKDNNYEIHLLYKIKSQIIIL